MRQTCAVPEIDRQWQGHGWVSQDEEPLGPKSCARRDCHLSRRSPFLTEAGHSSWRFWRVLLVAQHKASAGTDLAVLSRETREKDNGARGRKPGNDHHGQRRETKIRGRKKSPPIKTTGGL